ncbi:glycoside hydrolase family 88 protein [Natronogracilivirga saccharolytica]
MAFKINSVSKYFLSSACCFLTALVFLSISCSPNEENENLSSRIFDFSDQQLRYMIEELNEAIQEDPEGKKVSPRSVRDGEMFVVPSSDWTSGFLPGMLWMMYEYHGDEYWMEKAVERTAPIEREKLNDGTHDMGFKVFNSFGQGYRHTNDEEYYDIIIEASNTLITRYNETVGAIRSWDFNRDRWDFPVIIDNMMNLEMLFWASEVTGDKKYFDIAKQHAWTTYEEHFRDDYGSYHVVDFDTTTGESRKKITHQGTADESAWARGQAWGLYGFVMTYRYTETPEFLELAEEIADYMLYHPNMPEDLVPFWDYDAPGIPDAARDASAAAIMASALYELSEKVPEKQEYYRETADQVLDNLYSNYRSQPIGSNHGFLLDSSTGHHPHGYEIDTPLIYADYYLLEAALRKKSLRE